MRKIGLMMVLIVALLISGCKARPPVINMPPLAKHIERTTTKLIPLFIPGDSTVLRAYFECDSLNNVLMTGLSENKTPRMESDIEFKNGVLDYKAKAQPDTVYLKSDSVYIYVDNPFPVEVDKITYQQTKLQRIFYMIGIISTTAGAVWVITRFRFNKTF